MAHQCPTCGTVIAGEDEREEPRITGPTAEERVDRAMEAAGAFAKEIAARWKQATKRIDEDRRPEIEHERHDDRALEAGRAMFAGNASVVASAGIESLAGLDDLPAPAAKPSGALQVFWFIGTIFVLAGSVMGVREAWRTLEGVWRPVVIASAFFAYHVLFVGLARLLARRSATTGRVLAGIAAGLLPVVFVAAAVAVGQDGKVGWPFAGLLFAGSLVTLQWVGSIAHRHKTGFALALGLAPALALELAIGSGLAPDTRRAALGLVALAPLAIATTRARFTLSSSSLVGVTAAAYGAIAAAVLALYGGPGDEALSFDDGGIGSRVLVAWIAVAAAVGWSFASGSRVRARFGALPLVAALGTLVSAGAAALVTSFARTPEPVLFDRAPLAVLALATVVLVVEQRARPHVIHLAMLAAVSTLLIFARTFVPDVAMWAPICAIAPAFALSAGAVTTNRTRRAVLAWWGVGLGLLLSGATFLSENGPTLLVTTVLAVLAICAHVGARTTRPSLHFFGALFALAAVLSFAASPMLGCAGLAAVYGIAALVHERFVSNEDERRPLDDASLLAATFGVWFGVLFAPRVPSLAPLGLAAVLFLRAWRDRSALVVAQGAVALVLAGALFTGVRWYELDRVWLFGTSACGLAMLAIARKSRPIDAPRFGRAVHGLLPLPLSGTWRTWLDGFALVSLGLAVLALVPAVGFIADGGRGEADRPMVLLGLGAVVATAVLAFGTSAFDRLRARGSVLTLALVAVLAIVLAIANRIGRPLPPDVVGIRLTVVVVAVWIVARILVKVGPRLGGSLGREDEGRRYHHVAHAGVFAISVLLGIDAVFVVGPTPPMLVVGSALGMLLLYRSYGFEPLLHVGLLLGAVATALAFGPSASLGFAVATGPLALLLVGLTRSPGFANFVRVHVLAREDGEAKAIPRAVATALCVVSVGLSLLLAWTPPLVATGVFVLASAIATTATAPRSRMLPIVLAAPLLVHAWAQTQATIPWLAGPAFALLATVTVIAGVRASDARERETRIRLETQGIGLSYAFLAVAYAFATGAETIPTDSFARVLSDAAAAAAMHPVASFAPALTFAILAVTTAVAAVGWRGGITTVAVTLAPLLLGTAGLSLATAATDLTGPDAALDLVTREGPLAALMLAATATLAHLAAFGVRTARPDAMRGLVVARDVLLAVTAVVLCAFVKTRMPGGLAEGPCGVIALGLAVAVCVHAVGWQGTPRHVAFAETLLVAFYVFATRSLHLRPELDAMFGLLYGFSLLGVATIARRRGVNTVADATRRFAALLPAGVALFTLTGTTSDAAAYAFGASVLYGVIAWMERSRIFGSLAAFAANLGLVVLALSQGLEGAEIYIGPLGIFVAALAQIFAPKLTPAARAAVRILGGALLYLPAGLKLTLRLGAAEDARYALVFGVVCLLGVSLGIALRVRAYLALGTLFLTLDVIANLVYAGLRDHRVGFVLLSTAGLLILGAMILVTLRRDEAWALLGRLRLHLHAWD